MSKVGQRLDTRGPPGTTVTWKWGTRSQRERSFQWCSHRDAQPLMFGLCWGDRGGGRTLEPWAPSTGARLSSIQE